MTNPARVLIVEARFYGDIADALAVGATQALDTAGMAYERLHVPGVFEVPGAIHIALKAKEQNLAPVNYAGFIGLGCVIRGETDHYDHICREASRALMDISTTHSAAFGFGILTCENSEQAWARASVDQKNVGGSAASACLRMIEIKKSYQLKK